MTLDKAKVEARKPGNEAVTITSRYGAVWPPQWREVSRLQIHSRARNITFFFFFKKKEAKRGGVLIKDKVEDLDPYQLVSPLLLL